MVPGPPRDRRVASAAVVARSHFKRGSFTEPPHASAALVLDDGCPKKACGTRVSCSRGADHGARGECARGHVVRFCTVCCRFVAQESFVRQDARGHPEGHAPRHCGAQDNKGGHAESRRAANRLAEPAPAAARALPPPPVASSSICTAVGGATTGALSAGAAARSEESELDSSIGGTLEDDEDSAYVASPRKRFREGATQPAEPWTWFAPGAAAVPEEGGSRDVAAAPLWEPGLVAPELPVDDGIDAFDELLQGCFSHGALAESGVGAFRR